MLSPRHSLNRTALSWAAVLLLITISSPVFGQGVALRAVGPINESMGGASVACPLDSAGAIHWNPATISGLSGNDMSFGANIVMPESKLSSFVPGVGGGMDDSESGAVPAPTMSCVFHSPKSNFSYGFGMFAVAGVRANYPCDPNNPVLAPQQSIGPLGFGRLSAEVEVYQIVPAVSYQVNERLSVGFAPTVTVGRLVAAPLFLGPKNPDGTWSPGVGTRFHWGGGFQLGAYYRLDHGWAVGALRIKSRQWVEPFRYNSETDTGLPRVVKFRLDYPMIVSIGTSYSGLKDWVFALDMRYFDYANTTGFSEMGMAHDGAVKGLGWNSIMSVCFGAQRRLADNIFIRAGYCFNENPIGPDAVLTNVASPLLCKHSLHIGGSYGFANNWVASITYTRCFEESTRGPISAGGVTLPGAWVESSASAHSVFLGLSKRF